VLGDDVLNRDWQCHVWLFPRRFHDSHGSSSSSCRSFGDQVSGRDGLRQWGCHPMHSAFGQALAAGVSGLPDEGVDAGGSDGFGAGLHVEPEVDVLQVLGDRALGEL